MKVNDQMCTLYTVLYTVSYFGTQVTHIVSDQRYYVIFTVGHKIRISQNMVLVRRGGERRLNYIVTVVCSDMCTAPTRVLDRICNLGVQSVNLA